MAGLWYPGFFNPGSSSGGYTPSSDSSEITLDRGEGGLSSITFDAAAYSAAPETSAVDINNTHAAFASGVDVSFGELCLWDDAQQLEVRSLGSKSDGEYEAVGYDLTLDGGGAEFCGLVEVTLPYDSSWGDNVFVQYLNEDTNSWEIIYAEPDSGKVTFRTDHFCTFAVFRNMVESGRVSDPSGVLIETQGADDLHVGVKVNWAALAAQLKEGKLQSDLSLTDLTGKGDAYFADRFATILGNSITGLEYLSKLGKMPGAESVLGPLGQIITVGKFLYNGHKNGWEKSFKDNGVDLAMLAVATGSKIPGPVGVVCAGIALGYFVYSATSATVKDINNGGQDSAAEYAYRDFTMKFIEYNKRTGDCDYRYVSNVYDDAKTEVKAGYSRLTCGSTDSANANWREVFDAAKAAQKSGSMNASVYIDKMIDRYTNVFWSMPESDRSNYLKNTTSPSWFTWFKGGTLIDDYEAPTAEKRREYTQNLKNDIYAWLKPYIKEMMEQEYQNNLNSIYSYYIQLEALLNDVYTVRLTDPSAEYFSSSDYSGRPIGLSVSSSAAPSFVNQWRTVGNSCTIEFTGAAWVKEGCPRVLRVLGSANKRWDYDSTFYAKELDLKPGLNEVVLAESVAPSGSYKLKIERYTYTEFSLYIDNSVALGSLVLNGDGTVDITIPQFENSQFTTSSGGWLNRSSATKIQLKASPSDEPEVDDYEGGHTRARTYYITECTTPIDLSMQRDSSRLRDFGTIDGEGDLVIYGSGDAGFPPSRVLLYYDDNDILKKAAVEIQGHGSAISVIMIVQ